MYIDLQNNVDLCYYLLFKTKYDIECETPKRLILQGANPLLAPCIGPQLAAKE